MIGISSLFFILILQGLTSAVTSCSCATNFNLKSSYLEHNVLKVNILGKVTEGKSFNKEIIYVAKVLLDYSGTERSGSYILIKTPTHSCGATLTKGISIVSLSADSLDGKTNQNVYTTDACSFNTKYKNLGKDELDFLNARMICDGDGTCTCVDGTDPVNCLTDPCEVARCPADSQCVSSYCGGCNAECLTVIYW